MSEKYYIHSTSIVDDDVERGEQVVIFDPYAESDKPYPFDSKEIVPHLDRLMEIKENFYQKNSLPLEEDDGVAEGSVPVIHYPVNTDNHSGNS